MRSLGGDHLVVLGHLGVRAAQVHRPRRLQFLARGQLPGGERRQRGGGHVLGLVGARERVRVEQGTGADRGEPGDLLGDVGRAVHGRAGQPGAGVGVRRPVDLLAPGVGRHDEGAFLDVGGVGEAVQRAHAVHGDAERQPEGVGRHQADAQPGVGAGTGADDDPGDRLQRAAGLGEDPVDGRQQQLPVPARVHLARRGDDVRSVVQGDGDGGRCGIQSEQEHANSLRRPRLVHARPGRTVTGCYGLYEVRHMARGRGGAGDRDQLGNRGGPHRGGHRNGRLPRLPGAGDRTGGPGRPAVGERLARCPGHQGAPGPAPPDRPAGRFGQGRTGRVLVGRRPGVAGRRGRPGAAHVPGTAGHRGPAGRHVLGDLALARGHRDRRHPHRTRGPLHHHGRGRHHRLQRARAQRRRAGGRRGHQDGRHPRDPPGRRRHVELRDDRRTDRGDPLTCRRPGPGERAGLTGAHPARARAQAARRVRSGRRGARGSGVLGGREITAAAAQAASRVCMGTGAGPGCRGGREGGMGRLLRCGAAQ
ncbi:conserved hypothetical protein [Streptomyces misionensis JCM 4497]